MYCLMYLFRVTKKKKKTEPIQILLNLINIDKIFKNLDDVNQCLYHQC